MRRALVLVAVATAAWPGTAHARVVAATAHAIAGMSAWHGHLVFSQLDAASERWSLYAATASGMRRLPVGTAPVPFDADVGTDRSGRPVAVFSRCPSELSGSRRCRIRIIRLDLPGARSRVVQSLVSRRYSDGAPSIWRGRIAFGRVINGGTMAALFMQRRAGSRELVRLARGTIPVCPADGPDGPRCYRTATPRALDLGPARLAVVWPLAGGNAFAQVGEELWSVPLDGAGGRLLDVGGAGECGFGGSYSFRRFGRPFVAHRRVSYLAYLGDCWLTDSTFTRAGPRPLTRAERDGRSAGAPPTIVHDGAFDGRGWWAIRGPRAGPDEGGSLSNPCAEGRCRLTYGRVALERVPVTGRPRPPVETSDQRPK
jgi:hypothetical protein